MPPAPSSSPIVQPGRRLAVALVAGPSLLLAGMILMGMPGLWTPSHLIFLAGTLGMLPAGLALHRLTRVAAPKTTWSGLALTTVGALALAGQFVIDLTVMRLAAGDSEAAGELFDRIQASAAFELAFYSAGPSLLFIGLALSGAVLLLRSGPARWAGWALVGGTLLMGAGRASGFRPAEIAAGLVLLVALARAAGSPWPAAGSASTA